MSATLCYRLYCRVLEVSFLFYMHRSLQAGLSFCTLFNSRPLRESCVDSKSVRPSVRPSVTLVLAAKQFFAKFGTGVRYKKKVFERARVFTKSTVTKSFRASVSFHENGYSDKFSSKREFLWISAQWLKLFEQAWVFVKMGTVTKIFFGQAWVFMKIGTMTNKFSNKREFSWKSAKWLKRFRTSVSFHENRQVTKTFSNKCEFSWKSTQ